MDLERFYSIVQIVFYTGLFTLYLSTLDCCPCAVCFQVGFRSEPAKPSTAIVSGVIQEGSKVITLSFPQAQRAEFSAGSANVTQQKNGSGTPH